MEEQSSGTTEWRFFSLCEIDAAQKSFLSAVIVVCGCGCVHLGEVGIVSPCCFVFGRCCCF